MHFRLGDQARRLIVTGTAPQLPSGTVAERMSGAAAQRHSGTAAQRHSGTAAQRHSGTAAQRHSGTAAQRHSSAAAPQLPSQLHVPSTLICYHSSSLTLPLPSDNSQQDPNSLQLPLLLPRQVGMESRT
jgi:hypothetical protein